MLGGFLSTIARAVLGDEESEAATSPGMSPQLRPNPNVEGFGLENDNKHIENINSFVADTSPGLEQRPPLEERPSESIIPM